MTKTVLCYGDSLTWGYSAETIGRHAYEDRWPSALQAALGSDVRVIAEGLNGRTTAFDDHLADCDRNGARVLPTLLQTELLRVASARFRDTASALYTTAFNVGIGGGALVGGAVYAAWGIGTLPWAALAILAASLVMLFFTLRVVSRVKAAL